MSSISRILSQTYKSICSIRRNTFRLTDIFVWPIIILFMFTFFVSYLGSDQSYISMVILGMMGWRVIYFLNFEITALMTEEYWSKSLAYLFASPISRIEYILGAALSGMIKAGFVLALYAVLTYYIYGFIIADYGTFALAMLFIIMAGFTMGLFTLSLGYFMKDEAFNFSFILPDVLVLLSGVYFSIESVYPAEVLPFIRLLPTTQAFELLKSIVGLGHPDFNMLIITGVVWLTAAYLINGFMYNLARKQGKLTKLG
ncbi:ABC transporter permease [Candidatus Micrarchaeota archaeon]|nr:ABC transporter permease [Candidatus Micrarchaeota archaeon]